jgi:hypothetical protein
VKEGVLARARAPDRPFLHLRTRFLDPDGLGRINPSGSVAVFPELQFGDAFANGPDGDLWVLKESTVARVLPDGTATTFNLRMPQGDLHGPISLALTTGPDRNLWMYGYYAGSYVGRFTPPDLAGAWIRKQHLHR